MYTQLRKRFYPFKTVIELGADYNTQIGVWQFKSSWEDRIIGGRLTIKGRYECREWTYEWRQGRKGEGYIPAWWWWSDEYALCSFLMLLHRELQFSKTWLVTLGDQVRVHLWEALVGMRHNFKGLIFSLLRLTKMILHRMTSQLDSSFELELIQGHGDRMLGECSLPMVSVIYCNHDVWQSNRLGFRTERIQPLNLKDGVTLRRRLPLDGTEGHAKLEVRANLCLPEPEVGR